MDSVDFWDRTVERWKTENHCGLCWSFEAPLVESQANIIQHAEGEECCVQVIYTKPVEKEVPKFSQTTGLLNGINKDYSFVIHFVTSGDLSTNNYTEIKGHPKSESRWHTIYKPIKDCIDNADLLALLCEFIGKKVDVVLWQKEISHAYLDQNYFGWQIRATFRIEE